MTEAIYTQINEYCDCDEFTSNDEKYIDEAISIISSYTCWNNNKDICSTFLSMERKIYEKLTISNKCTNCNQNIFYIDLWYKNIFPSSIKVYLEITDGINITTKVVESFRYSDTLDKLIVDVDEYVDEYDICSCPKSYILIIEFFAGYEQIPDCLLPIFCDLVAIIKDINGCTCGECEKCTNTYANNSYVNNNASPTNPNIAIDFDLKKTIGSMLKHSYFKNLQMISICRDKRDLRLWGVVTDDCNKK